jgi:TatD DNase family protein
MIIDTHAHLNFAAFDGDRETVIENSLAEGVFMINAGANFSSSKLAVEIAEKHEQGVWAAIGLHPLNLSCQKRIARDLPEDFCEDGFDAEKYFALAESKKVAAIGEIGLDCYYKPKTNIKIEAMVAAQKEALRRQLLFARETNLPAIFHCRMAHREMIDILHQEFKKNGNIAGVLHCFTGGTAELAAYLDLGLRIGLNGIIFKMNLDDVIKKIPRQRILLETDCPYLAPPPLSGRNEPKNAMIIAQRVAQIRNELPEALIATANQNARELFRV